MYYLHMPSPVSLPTRNRILQKETGRRRLGREVADYLMYPLPLSPTTEGLFYKPFQPPFLPRKLASHVRSLAALGKLTFDNIYSVPRLFALKGGREK